MPVTDYNSDPGLNGSVLGINIAELCDAANINNAMRQILADIADWRAATLIVEQVGSVAGTGAQVELLFGSLTLPADAQVMFFAKVTGGPAGGGALWNTHFEVDNDGSFRALSGFPASSSEQPFTNFHTELLTAGTHRISLYWYGQNGSIGTTGARLMAKML